MYSLNKHIQGQLREALGQYNIASLPKNSFLGNENIDRLKKIQSKDLILTPMNEESPVKIEVDVPWESSISKSINLYVILTGNGFYQLDIDIATQVQHLGLGYKIYKAMVQNFGHIYSGNGRRLNNNEIPKILEKLGAEPDMELVKNRLGYLVVSVNASNKRELILKFNGK